MTSLEIKEVKSGAIDYRELFPLQPEAYKRLSSSGFDKMYNSLSRKGFRVPFQIWYSEDEKKHYILDGHQRRTFINELKQRGIPLTIHGEPTFEVPVVFIYAESKKDAAELILAIDSQYGDRDVEGIFAMLEEFDIDDEWIDMATSIEEVIQGVEKTRRELELEKLNEAEPEEDHYEIPEHSRFEINEGDLIEIGPHRVLCGDATKAESYERLFQGEKAKMVNTDPPYNVDYKGGTKAGLKILNDKMDQGQFYLFLHDFYSAMNKHVIPGGAWYIWHADSQGAVFRLASQNTGIVLKQCLIWVKNQFTLGRQDHQWRHEPCLMGENESDWEAQEDDHLPCLYGWNESGPHFWYSDRKQSTVLEYNKPLASREHPTMKPVDMIGHQVKNSSQPGDIVADGFLGSGTLMVGCHQIHRICYGLELDPRFCSVIIDRMLKLDPSLVVKINGEILQID